MAKKGLGDHEYWHPGYYKRKNVGMHSYKSNKSEINARENCAYWHID